MQKNLICAAMIACVLFAVSCKKDDATQVTGTVAASQTVDESAGTASITVTLPSAQSSAVTISYTLSGTAIENGDYMVTSDQVMTIAAGETTATFTVQIFDDEVVEDDQTIEVAFTSTGVNLSSATSTITITDNDTDASVDGLNADLTWDAGTMVDLDLYWAYNVTLDDNGYIEDGYSQYHLSDNEYGWENSLLSNDADDQEYYLATGYYSGSRAVDYTLNLLQNGELFYNYTYNMTTDDVGYAYFIGPITKSGSTYGRTGKVTWDASKATVHKYKVKVEKK